MSHHLNLLCPSRHRQTSSATRLGYSNRGTEAGRGGSSRELSGSEDRMSTTTASPSSLQPHLQTLQLNWGSVAAKCHMKPYKGPHFSHYKSLSQRRK